MARKTNGGARPFMSELQKIEEKRRQKEHEQQQAQARFEAAFPVDPSFEELQKQKRADAFRELELVELPDRDSFHMDSEREVIALMKRVMRFDPPTPAAALV